MEYILNSEMDGIDFDRYRAYVESIRSKLPAHVYAFASNPSYFNLDSRSSLHDAWLENLTVKETPSGERKQVRHLEIHLCLFGHIMTAGFT
jgi:isocitrate lyase